MTILNDKQIRFLAEQQNMISPFAGQSVKEEDGKKIISYGLSSFGYDLRASNEWKIFTNVNSKIVDPKDFDRGSFVDVRDKEIIIPPNSFVLARSIEYIKVPPNVMIVCVGKSTYARCGIVANVTPLEAGWEGYVTLEFSNTTPLPAKMYANEGCVQLIFFQGMRPSVTYADREGKYMKQTGITLPRI